MNLHPDATTPLTSELVVVAQDQQSTLDESVGRLHAFLLANHSDRFPGEWEITVADVASTDNTFAIAQTLAKQLPGVTARHIATDGDHKSLRNHWSTSSAIVVAFVWITPTTDLAALIAPLVTHSAQVRALTPSPAPVADIATPIAAAIGDRVIHRRTALAAIGGTGLMVFLAACGASSKSSATTTTTTTATAATTQSGGSSTTSVASTTAAGAEASSTSVASSTSAATTLPSGAVKLTPELTEGPYYLDLNLVRSDITEGHPGAPLALTLAVLNVADGKPIPGATVDIWHADALGVYSGFVASSQGGPPVGAGGGKGDGTTFCRGTQLTDSSGNVTFKTVYAGWYQGRAVHMHIKVHVGGKQIHTGQIFFDDNLTDEVYGTTAPYATRGLRDLLNSDDAIFNQGGAATVITPKQSSTGYAASLAMGVQAA